MTTRSLGPAVDERAPTWRFDAGSTLSVLRSVVGAASWTSPALSWRSFGLGLIEDDPRSMLITRLFGVRDLALGLAVQHPNPDVHRAALDVGVAVDAMDVVASLFAFRRGASRASLVLIGGGAALFVGLGLAARADRQS